MLELYLHSPSLHGIMLNQLSIGTILFPSFLAIYIQYISV
jgi:hypothetical protein